MSLVVLVDIDLVILFNWFGFMSLLCGWDCILLFGLGVLCFTLLVLFVVLLMI